MKVENRNYYRDYEEIESYEAGISLTGAEVKCIKMGRIRLDEAFVRFLSDGPHLINADIPAYSFANDKGYNSKRSRKLLLHKKEILRLQTKMKVGGRLTVAPISTYIKGRFIKVQIALSKGRKDVEKKKYDKAKDIAINQKREAKEHMKT
ncbi:MAG: SsrA-binding protein [Candidatus Roizmanbacteria bacterium]